MSPSRRSKGDARAKAAADRGVADWIRSVHLSPEDGKYRMVVREGQKERTVVASDVGDASIAWGPAGKDAWTRLHAVPQQFAYLNRPPPLLSLFLLHLGAEACKGAYALLLRLAGRKAGAADTS